MNQYILKMTMDVNDNTKLLELLKTNNIIYDNIVTKITTWYLIYCNKINYELLTNKGYELCLDEETIEAC